MTDELNGLFENQLRQYLGREKSLLLELEKIQFKSEHAQRHIKLGLYRRLDMIRYSLGVIREIAGADRSALLEHDETNRINVHVNSLYTHFRGGIDNLAWSLAHECSLFEPVDESNSTIRRKCHLFGNAFLSALDHQGTELASILRDASEWAIRLKEMRDPVSHRIPLYVPRGMLNEDEAEQYRRLHQEAHEAIQAGDAGTHWGKVQQAEALGSFGALVLLSEPDGVKSGPLLSVVDDDHSKFMNVCEAVTRFLRG